MKILKLVLSCLIIIIIQTTASAQLLYNNGVSITVNGGVLLYVDGTVQNESGLIDVDYVSANSELIIQGNFINNATAGGDGYYRVIGDWINNNIFNAGTGTVFIEGATQLLDGSVSTYFYNLTLDGTAVKTQTIDQYCTGVLSLNDIELQTEIYGFFVENTSVSAITLGTGFISSFDGGFLSRKTNVSSVYLFPVGSSIGTARYRPVEITPTAVTANTYTVRMGNLDATIEGYDISQMATDVCQINPLFYHQINRTNGTSAINLDIYYENIADGDWEGISNWTTSPDLWDIIVGSSTASGSPLYKASATAWNDFSETPYALYAPTPVAEINSNTPVCEGNDIFLLEIGSDAVSWSWEGPNGFTSTDHNPTISAVDPAADGLYSVTITNAYGCAASDSETVTVDAAVDATITADGPFCITDATVNLIAVSMGGTWSGTGVSGDTFDPATAGAGDHLIQYDIINGACSDSDTKTFHVDSDVDATITPAGPFCETDAAVALIAITPSGVWSGTGVVGNTFDPTIALINDNIIQYDVVNGACSDSDTETIHVDSDVDATITPIGPFCEVDAAIALTAVTPGGVWSGTGIIDAVLGTFNPATAIIGDNSIGYVITNGACSDSDAEIMHVDSYVDATITQIGPFCTSEAAVPLVAVDAGGTWTGTGVVGTNYDPTIAGNGTHNVQYNIINGACSDSDNIDVEVNANPISPVTSIDCTGGEDAGLITVTAPIGAEYEYTVDGFYQASTILGPLTNGTYTITVQDINTSCTTAGNIINLDCGCSNPTSLTLSSTSDNTCGVEPEIVIGSTFGGSATEVNLSHDGSGSLDQLNIVSSPFDFTYTPDPADAGNTVIITVTTDNPEGSPCSSAIQNYTLTVYALPNVTAGNSTPVCDGGSLTLTETGGNANTWNWDGPNLFSSTDHNPVLSPISVTDNGTYNVTVLDVYGCTNIDNVLISVNPTPIITIGSNSPICEGSDINLTETGGEANDWDWIGPDSFTSDQQNPSVLAALPIAGGTYNLTVTDINGCTSSDNVLVQVDTDVDATITNTGPYCESETSIALTANSAGGIWLGPGVTGSTFDPSSAGFGDHVIQYDITNGECSDTDTETLHVDTDVDATITPIGPFCESESAVTLTAADIGGTWAGNGVTGDSFDPAAATDGIHNITYNIINGACSDSDDIDITVNANPTSPTTSINCSGGENAGIITVTAPLGANYEYTIDGLYQSTIDFGPLTNGSYTVTVQDITSSCTTSGTVLSLDCGCVNAPTLILSANSSNTCGTELVSINGNTFGGSATQVDLVHNGTGSLDAAQFLSSPFSFTYTPDVADIGLDVTITVTTNNPDGAPCIPAIDTYVITVLSLPNVTVGSNSPICSGDDITLTETGGDAIDWDWTGPDSFTSDQQNPTISGATSTQSGTYTVIVEGINTCTITSDIDVIVNDPPTLTLSAASANACGTDAATISGNTFGGGTSEVTITHDGNGTLDETTISSSPFSFTYNPDASDIGNIVTITITTDNPSGSPCNATQEIFTLTMYDSPQVSASSNSPVCEGNDINFTETAGDATNWQWEGPNSFTSTDNSPTITNPTTSAIGSYTVTITDSNGCTASDNLTVLVIVAPDPTISEPGVICSGTEPFNLTATNTGGVWSGTGVDPSTGEFDPEIAGIGNHEIIYTISGPCGNADTIYLTVSQQADATIVSALDTLFITDPAVYLEATDNGGLWSGNGTNETTGEFIPSIADLGNHEIIYTISGACGDADSIIIVVISELIPDLLIPDVLTPNNDGYNDTWRIQGIRAFENVNIVIFNRWGDEVFTFTGTGYAYFELANQFDGIRNGKELPFGTYVYLLELDYETVYKGTLTIIR